MERIRRRLKEMTNREFAIKKMFFFLSTVFLFRNEDTFTAFSKEIDFLWEPQVLFEWFHFKLQSAQTISYIHSCWMLTGIMSAIGFLSRISMVAFACISFYLFGFEAGFIFSSFHFYHVILISFILAFSPKTDFSIDSLIEKKYFMKKSNQPKSSILYRAFSELVIFVSISMLFCSALSKLCVVGWEWVFDNNSYFYMHITTVWFGFLYPTWILDVKNFFLQFPWFIAILGGMALIGELLSPLLFFPKLRIWGLLYFVAMFIGIYILLSITTVRYLIPLIFFWIPCELIFLKLKKYSGNLKKLIFQF